MRVESGFGGAIVGGGVVSSRDLVGEDHQEQTVERESTLARIVSIPERFAPVAAPVTGESLRPTRYAGPRAPGSLP